MNKYCAKRCEAPASSTTKTSSTTWPFVFQLTITSWQMQGQLFAKPITPTRKQIVTSLQRPTGWADKDKSTSETSTTEISATIYYASHHQICRNTICVCENPFMFTKTAIDQHHCETTVYWLRKHHQ